MQDEAPRRLHISTDMFPDEKRLAMWREIYGRGIARVDIDDVSRAYLPYLMALLVGLALIAAFPVLTLVLPRVFLGYRG